MIMLEQSAYSSTIYLMVAQSDIRSRVVRSGVAQTEYLEAERFGFWCCSDV